MRDAAREATEFTAGRHRRDLEDDRMLALVKAIEIMRSSARPRHRWGRTHART
jgi:hypothetical protein